MDKISNLGMPLDSKTYSRGTRIKAWGCPRHPFFINKATDHLSIRYIFIASYPMCCFWSVFIFVLFYFVCCSIYWIPAHLFCIKTRSFLMFGLSILPSLPTQLPQRVRDAARVVEWAISLRPVRVNSRPHRESKNF
jgi:hypothetical protein